MISERSKGVSDLGCMGKDAISVYFILFFFGTSLPLVSSSCRWGGPSRFSLFSLRLVALY